MRKEPGNGTWWVYMIACRGGRIYTGTALDPEARFRAHREGKGAAFTRANPPVALLHSMPFGSRGDACRAEAALKKLSREEKVSWTRGEVKEIPARIVESEECPCRNRNRKR
jgi:putative endonuclease